MSRGRGALALLAVLLTPTACSTVPTASPTVQITQAPFREDTEVDIRLLSPEPGASPEDIVRGFIDAAASTALGRPVAREHLAPPAAEAWADDTGVTIIESGYAVVAGDDGRVTVTATTVGSVDQDGIFRVGGDVLTRDYTVVDVGGEWRIADPPDGLVILDQDFQRLYDELHAFFLDPTGRRVVPDPRYLIGGEAQPTALVERLFDGPAPALRAGVRNVLEGLSLRRPVTVQGAAATVDLTGVPTDPDFPLEDLCAQLVWTLEQARIRSVEVLVDGEPVQVSGVPREQTVDDWASHDPDAVRVDAVGHYVDAGGLRTFPAGAPVPGPAGEGAYRLASASAAADPETGELSFVVGVTEQGRDGRTSLLAGPYGGTLSQVLSGRSFTAPSVAATRTEIWTVRDGIVVVRVPAGATPQTVGAAALRGLGSVQRLQLSPDGVRAALVVGAPPARRLLLGTIERGEDGGVALRDLREVNPALTDVVDAGWRDSATLLVLARDPSDDAVVPLEVGVDGWGPEEVSTSGLPDEPTAVAAAPSRGPLVSAGGTIWQLLGGTWVTLVPGEQPRPGTEPFYPL